MKRKRLIFILAGTSLLSFTACGNTDTTTGADIQTEVFSEESETSAVSTQSTEPIVNNQYSVTLETQEIIYLTPTGNTELATVSLQTPTLTSSQSIPLSHMNEAFIAASQKTLSIVDGTTTIEGDISSSIVQRAYDTYCSIEASDKDESFPSWYAYNQEYSIQRIDDLVFSAIETIASYSGGAHGSQIQSGVNYNMQTGNTLSLTDLSSDTDAFLSYCSEQLIALADIKQAEENVFFDGYKEHIYDIITDNTFYFSREGLCFISQEYVLQPYAAGTITLCIPYENLKGYLKDEYFPTDTSWDFEVTGTVKEPITCSFQPDFRNGVVTPMLDSFLSWTGLLYFYSENTQLDSLTTEAALSMAGFAIISDYAYEEAWYDDSVGGYTMPVSLVDTYTKNYFGQTYDISSFQSTEQYLMVRPTENGELLVQVGDWGTVSPRYEIADTTKNEDGSYTVSVNYLSYDHEFDEESDTLATASYVFTPDSNSTFGYVITDMQFLQTATIE